MAEQTQPVDRTEQAFNTAGAMIAAGDTVRQIQTSYVTAVAVQQPRDIEKVRDRCRREAAIAGARCFYGWAVKGKKKGRIEGPSVKLAMIAVRNWGNCAVEMMPMHETPTSYVMTAAFIDIETGVTITRQFRQSKKWIVYGDMDEFRKDDVRFQIGQSKAQRNVVLHSLPEWLIDDMMETAKAGVRAKIEKYVEKHSIDAARKLAVDAFGKHGVTVERIEAVIGRKMAAWDVNTLVGLQGDLQALDDQEEDPDVMFPELETEGDDKPEDKGPAGAEPGDPGKHQEHPNADHPRDAGGGEPGAGAGEGKDGDEPPTDGGPGPATQNAAAQQIRTEIIEVARKKELPGAAFNKWLTDTTAFSPVDNVPDSMLADLLKKVKRLTKAQCKLIIEGGGLL
jgi:hypothetical protein